MKIFPNTDWVAGLVPDLAERLKPFVVDDAMRDEELVNIFIKEARHLADELREGLAHGDAERVRVAAHSFKGMCGLVGLPEISVLGQEIEIQAREGRLDDARPLIGGLFEWLAAVGGGQGDFPCTGNSNP